VGEGAVGDGRRDASAASISWQRVGTAAGTAVAAPEPATLGPGRLLEALAAVRCAAPSPIGLVQARRPSRAMALARHEKMTLTIP